MFGFRPKLGTGCVPDPKDPRDFSYSDVMGTGESVTEEDWDKGFDAFKEVGILPITQDQDGSSSCTGQAMKSYFRRLLKQYMHIDKEQSARFPYAQVALPQGGAYIRDTAVLAASKGMLEEVICPSYENGRPPSESYMRNYFPTASDLTLALNVEHFSARAVDCPTSDINQFAYAIKNHLGCLGGFTGTNKGFCKPVVTPPAVGETTWNHCIDLCAFGKLDRCTAEYPIGTKCLFTKNSWGDRYAIQDGRWKGYQAIPEAYFTAGQNTAAGYVKGIYVFNAWVLVPDSDLTPAIKYADFLKQNEGKLVQDSEQSGAFGLIKGGKILVAPKERVSELIATYIVKKEGIPLPKECWNAIDKLQF